MHSYLLYSRDVLLLAAHSLHTRLLFTLIFWSHLIKETQLCVQRVLAHDLQTIPLYRRFVFPTQKSEHVDELPIDYCVKSILMTLIAIEYAQNIPE